MSTAITRIKIGFEQDVVYARQRARLLADVLGYDLNDQTRIGTAVSEIARNAYQYGGGGEVEFALEGTPKPHSFTITVRDHGAGIKNLDAIMEGHYTSHTGMGIGMMGARRLMDDFRIETAPESGTAVFMKKNLPLTTTEITPVVLNRIADTLAAQRTESPLDEIRIQNQELLRTLDELSRQRKELEDTNRGVLALYAELDEKVIELQGVDQLKSRFLSHMSHEFRTPLNSILALTRLLLDRADGDLTPEQEKQVTFILEAASDLHTLVSGLLDLAKIESGKMNVTPRACSVEEIFSSLRGMVKPMVTNKDVELIFEQQKNIPELFMDDGKVSQILRNFLSNALKFTVSGSIRVLARTDENQSIVSFAVEDTGIGIAAKDLERIFDEYAQVETAQQGRPKGTGLGLPISRKLAELLGGRISVVSTPGKGSTFSVHLPVRYGSESTPAPDTAQKAMLPFQVQYCMKPIDREWLLGALRDIDRRAPIEKVLIIDDDSTMRHVFRNHLIDTDYTLIEAADGATGLNLAHDARPGVIVLDLIMPGMDGFEVLEQLKSHPSTQSIPIIICTSKLLDEDDIKFLHRVSGADRGSWKS